MPAPSFIKTLSTAQISRRVQTEFDTVRLRLASPEIILSWSHGEVTKPETINYRTQKPERDGLFCERIFGPVKDWECACGKYKKIRFRGIVCDRCGVEVTRSIVRRERMGHISLATPVTHIWFLRGIPSRIGLILDLSMQALEKVVYFANFIIINVDEELKDKTLEDLNKEFGKKKKALKKETKEGKKVLEKRTKELKIRYDTTKREIADIVPKRIISESSYRELSLKYGHLFEADIGAGAILKLLSEIDLKKLIEKLKRERAKTKAPNKLKKLTRQLGFIQGLLVNKIKPVWMILRVIPVIPPDLRPMVQLDGGRFASSDLNDLYRRVINRNNRLKRLQELNAPEVICRNEKRMLQEAIDALIDNDARVGKTVTASTGGRRELKSLAGILRGKQGRFRRNLLGKRVDYSGRSVIVVGPHLKLHQCGLPKVMAIELFKPFVIGRLIKEGHVHNVRSAGRMIANREKEVWDILEEVIKDAYVLLNRAPTLHRLGIQAFQPVLIEGKAIQIHPLVCPAFNADFDGDQMAVHVPLTKEAKKEAKEILLASHNLLKPATGDPINTPTKDMVWGSYWMTFIRGTDKTPKIFATTDEAILAYQLAKIKINQPIKVKIAGVIKDVSVGRVLFNSILPEGLYNLDQVVEQKVLRSIVNTALRRYGIDKTAQLLDAIKDITFEYLTYSGLSWCIDDLPELPQKMEFIKEAEKKIDEIQSQYEQGLLADNERHAKIVETWTAVTDKITKLGQEVLPKDGSVFSMVASGARGSWSQVTQMLGMKGLVANPAGRIIELPIKSSFKEGFDVLEYFIATHGARKGVADTALRTASAGYLTRRLVDVAQDIMITENDCKDKEGIIITRQGTEEMGETLARRVVGRVTVENIVDPKTKKVVVKKGEFITPEISQKLEKLTLYQIKIRSVLSCRTRRGVCAKCYGYDLAYMEPVKLGAAVGIVAAQSIGEPGTQLTLRTFHTGGIAGRDITQGLPRVEELFEARSVKVKAILTKNGGTIQTVQEAGQIRKIIVKAPGQKDEYSLPPGMSCWVRDGQKVNKGDPLTEGSFDLYELYHLKGREAVQRYLLKEIQYIYSSQGQRLNDKHIELIARQMFSRYLVINGGDTKLLIGEIIPRSYLEEINRKLTKGQKPAEVKELLLGVTKVSLTTDSFLSAASFQETSRVLIEAAVTGKEDRLYGLKENVIIGRLIPVGTGFKK